MLQVMAATSGLVALFSTLQEQIGRCFKLRSNKADIILFLLELGMIASPLKLNLIIRQNSSKNTPSRISQVDSNINPTSNIQLGKHNIKQLINSQNQLNELFRTFLKHNLGLSLPSASNIESNHYKPSIRISNFETKQRMKYGNQFKELLDPRDKILQHDFDFNIQIDTKSIQQHGFLKSKTYAQIIDKIRQFMVQTLANILSVSFKALNDKQLEQKEVKNYAASNIMLNLQSIFTKTIEAIQSSKKLNDLGCFLEDREVSPDLRQLKIDLIVKLQNITKNILTNQDAYYPQAPITGGSLKMKSVIHEINRTDDEENDLIYSNRINISKHLIIKKIDSNNGDEKEQINLREDEDYAEFIMEVVNCAIKVVQTGEEDSRDRVNKQIFNEFNKQLFALSQNQQFKSLVQQATNSSNKLAQEYKQAVTSYFQMITGTENQHINTVKNRIAKNRLCQDINKQRQQDLQQLKDYAIGIKIPNYVKQFNKQQMAQKQFRAKHSSVLRILTKWAQNLERIINNPEQHIMMRIYPLKDVHNKLVPITNQDTKLQIVKKLKEQQQQVKQKLKQIKARNLDLIGQIMTKENGSLPHYVYRFTQTRQVSSIINALLTSLMVEYLSVLIHYLLKAGKQISFQNQKYLVSLVVFQVSDLMRARFKCSQSSFITLLKTMYLLDQSKAMKGKFKMVRIKNKLEESANNIMVNYMFMGRVQCQLQLSIQESKGKEKNYFIFSHFIYELRRGNFGVISQCAIMISQLDPIVANSCDELYYEQVKQEKMKVYKKDKEEEQNPNSLILSQILLSQKDDTIYDCIICKKLIIKGELKLIQKVEGTNKCLKCLFSQKPIQGKINQQIVQLKQQITQNLSQYKIKRITSYEQLDQRQSKEIRLYLRVNSAGKMQFETVLYMTEELKHFIIKISPQLLDKIANKELNVQYVQEIDYIFIQKLMKKKQPINDCFLFEITDKQSINQYLTKLEFKQETFYQQLDQFIKCFKSFRKEKNLIKSIKFKTEILSFSDDNQKWKCFKKILKIYSNPDNKSREEEIKTTLKYKKYKQLQFEKIKVIVAKYNSILEANDEIQEKYEEILEACHNLEELRIIHNQSMKNVDFLKNITSIKLIDLNNNNIQNIDGLKNIRNINQLNISFNRLQDIDALQNCTGLQKLDIRHNILQSVDGLKKIRNIKQLYLSFNNLQNVDVLSNCTGLETLCLNGNQLKEVSCLKYLKNLKHLYMSINKLQNLNDLQTFTNIQTLYIRKNKLQNLDGLSNCITIDTLCVIENEIKNVDGLRNIRSIKNLYLSKNQIKNLDGLKNCTTIQTLYAHENSLQNVDGLKNIKNIKKLKLSQNRLENVDGLLNCMSIETLHLNENNLRNLDGLKNIRLIKDLYLTKNQLQNVDWLTNCTAIEILDLSHNSLQNVDGLKNIRNIKQLYLSKNSLQNVDGLINCSAMEILDISHNNLQNVQGLKNIRNMGTLYLNRNQLPDVDGLKNCTFFETLYLNANKLENIDGLKNCMSIEILYLSGNSLTSVQALRNIKNIKHLYLSKNKLQNLDGLQNSVNIETLYLSGNNLKSVDSLKKITKISFLKVDKNQQLVIQQLPQNISVLGVNYKQLKSFDFKCMQKLVWLITDELNRQSYKNLGEKVSLYSLREQMSL